MANFGRNYEYESAPKQVPSRYELAKQNRRQAARASKIVDLSYGLLDIPGNTSPWVVMRQNGKYQPGEAGRIKRIFSDDMSVESYLMQIVRTSGYRIDDMRGKPFMELPAEMVPPATNIYRFETFNTASEEGAEDYILEGAPILAGGLIKRALTAAADRRQRRAFDTAVGVNEGILDQFDAAIPVPELNPHLAVFAETFGSEATKAN